MGLGFLSTKASARVIKTVVRTKTIQRITPPPPKEKVINNIITDSSEVEKIGSRMSELEDKVSRLASELQKYNESQASTPRTPIELHVLPQPPLAPPVIRAPPPPPPPPATNAPTTMSSVDLFLAELKRRVQERESRRVGDEIPSVLHRSSNDAQSSAETDAMTDAICELISDDIVDTEPDEILVVSANASAKKSTDISLVRKNISVV